MERDEVEKFIHFAKEQFGVGVSFEKSEQPDSFETFFGESFLDKKKQLTNNHHN